MTTLTVTPAVSRPKQFNSNNQPNAAKMIPALRKLGYDNKAAIADLVDNSLDAAASIVSINIFSKKSEPQIIIADNGVGMSRAILDEALRFGSQTEKDATSDLGKFGMGLSTASLSLAKRCTVITLANGEYWTAITDVDIAMEQNTFDKYLELSTDTEIEMFKHYVNSESGTVVILDNCDGLTTSNLTNLKDSLKKDIGRIFRYYIDSGRQILINEKLIASFDPLRWDDAETEHVLDEKFKHEGETVRIKLVVLPLDAGTDTNDTANMYSQGLYLMRNNREIVAATWVGMSKHNDYNYVRGEVLFSGGLDEEVGIPFTKQAVVLKQSLRDRITAIVKPELVRIRRDAANKRTAQTADDQQDIHDIAAKEISAKDKLLTKPLRKQETRDEVNDESRERKPAENKGGEHVNITMPKLVEGKLKCEFVLEHLGQGGQIYEAEMMGGKLRIAYNLDHPFYEKFIAMRTKSEDGRAVAIATDFLVYSLASAEVRTLQDSDTEVISTFKSAVSNNLRVLLR